ncbi:MAG: acyl-ACP--UDP-N-acetylglucosamine O-acyltransferase [Verrucomicrobia bacterium]|nr:acyl-ACP--UDP-N-acetylglucosamine O-acyltransferase [Cytophagales bacterium]
MSQILANIHPEAKIAAGVVIEPFATIQKNVEIGEGTWIGPNTVIMEGARIGKNCKIFPGAVVSGVPQDLKFSGEESITIIGDNTTIREFVTISRGTVENFSTEIGSNCLVMAYAHIAHDCVIGNNCIIVNVVQLAGHVRIGDFAIVGGASAVHQWVHIGPHAMISGGSLVRKDVPPFIKAAREPLSYAGINSVGLRRRGFSGEKISEIQDLYRIIYLKGLNTADALEAIESETQPSEERDLIMNFLKNSERGIIKGFTKGSNLPIED